MQLDFYNHNAGIAYPLVDIPTGRRVGGLDWRDDVLLDCGFVVEAATDTARLTRVQVARPNLIYRFQLGRIVADVAVPLDAAPGAVTRAQGAGWDGYVVTGPGHSAFNALYDGTRSNLLPTLEVEPGCLQWLHDAFVTEIRLANRAAGSDMAVPVLAADGSLLRLTGVVEFMPGVNAAVSALTSAGTLEIRDDLGGGGAVRPCWPDSAGDVSCNECVRTINGVGPDGNGGLRILGGSRVEVTDYPELHRIVIDFTKALSDTTCDV
jgi:hypothetical protein